MPVEASRDLHVDRPLGDDETRRLHARVPGAPLRVLILTYALLAAAYAIALASGTPVGYVVGFALVVAVQTRMAALMHEGAHGLVHADRTTNDRITNWLAAFPIGMTVEAYRRNHIRHHLRLGTNHDPDFVRLCVPPIERGLVPAVVRGVSGWRHAQLLFKYVGDSDAIASEAERTPWTSVGARGLVQGGLFTAGVLAGQPWAYLGIWVAPLLTVAVLINELRTMVEHTPLLDRSSSSDSARLNPIARTVHASWLARQLVAPLNFHYHHEHHLYPGVPFSRLPDLHRALASTGYYDRNPGVLWRGYGAVLRALWSTYGPRRRPLQLGIENGTFVAHPG